MSWKYILNYSVIYYLFYLYILANTDQIDAAKEVIKKLQFTYSTESFENPVLQKHWRNIEALALDRDAPEDHLDHTSTDSLYSSIYLLVYKWIYNIYVVY